MTYEVEVLAAIDLVDAGKNKKGIEVLTKIIRKEPAQPRAYFERAIAYLNLEVDDKAVVDLEKCLAIDRNYPGAKEWLSRALSGTGSKANAADKLYQAIANRKFGEWDIVQNKWSDCALLYLEAKDVMRRICFNGVFHGLRAPCPPL